MCEKMRSTWGILTTLGASSLVHAQHMRRTLDAR
jgi:hypothetical protein